MLALSWERSLGPFTLDFSHLKAVSKLFWTSPTWIEHLEIDLWHFSFFQNLAKCKGFPLCHREVRKSTEGSLTAQSKLGRSKTLVKCRQNIGPALHSFVAAFPMSALSWERSLGPLTLDFSHLKAVSKLFWTSPTWIEHLEIDLWHFSVLQNPAKCKGFPLCHRQVRKSTDGSLKAQSKLGRSKTLVKCRRNIGPALYSFVTAFPMSALSWERSLGP